MTLKTVEKIICDFCHKEINSNQLAEQQQIINVGTIHSQGETRKTSLQVDFTFNIPYLSDAHVCQTCLDHTLIKFYGDKLSK